MAQGSAAVVPLITYTRGDKVIKSRDGVHTALAGSMKVGGHMFDTMEARGRPWLRPGTYRCTMETASKNVRYVLTINGKKEVQTKKRQQIRPQDHGVMVDKSAVNKKGKTVTWKQEAAILIHPAAAPEDLEGCIAPGFLHGSGLRDSVICMMVLLDLCGGYADDKEVMLKVENNMK
ncbi:MAG: hypothetical protein IT557_16975 [Alphaproteobacteria bacterium]|nr:hypothetical protein [Alphaproteobacteria bacterium]